MENKTLAIYVCIKPCEVWVPSVKSSKMYFIGDLRAMDSEIQEDQFWKRTTLPWITINQGFNDYIGAP